MKKQTLKKLDKKKFSKAVDDIVQILLSALVFLFMYVLANIIIIGREVWKQAKLDVATNIITTFNWCAIMLILISALVFMVFKMKYYNNLHAVSALLLLVIIFLPIENYSFFNSAIEVFAALALLQAICERTFGLQFNFSVLRKEKKR